MVITTKFALPLTVYLDADGAPVKLDDKGQPTEDEKAVVIRTHPGSYNYREVNHKDPRVAEQLRVYRKHNRIGFSEILPSDVAIMDAVKGTSAEKMAVLKKETGLREPPVIRKPAPAPKGKVTESPNRVASAGKVKHAGHSGGSGADAKPTPGSGKKEN